MTRTKAPPAPVSTGFWLMKSEPESYSIEAFAKDRRTFWTGVRNYQARNFMMHTMVPGDHFIFYHSNADPSAAVGIGKIRAINQPDPSALDPKSDYHDPKSSHDHPIWFCAEVEFVSAFARPVTLAEIKNRKELTEMLLLKKGQRLSIQPVTKREFEAIKALGQALGRGAK